MNDIDKYSKVRRYKYGINALILTISVIGIIFVINAILPRYSKQFDLTENNRFTLTPQTIKVLKNLDKDVYINMFSKEGDPQNEMMNDLLKQYVRWSKFIHIYNIDFDKDPSLAKYYKVTKYGSVIFECGDMKSMVEQKQIFDFGFGVKGHNQSPKFNGELVVTDNIMKVTSREKTTVYFMIGHNERLVSNMEDGGLSKMQDYLIRENYEVRSINLSIDPKIPVENTILIMAGPKYILMNREIQTILDYLEKGGKLFLMIDPQVDASKSVNIFLNKWGAELAEDLVMDPELSYYYDPLAPIPSYLPHNINDDLSEARIGVVFPGARTVSKSEYVPDDLDVKPLLLTSDKSWAEKDLNNKNHEFNEDDDVKGPLTIAVVIEEKDKKTDSTDTTESDKSDGHKINDKASKGKIVVVGDSDFSSNRMAKSQGNIDYFMNIVNWLAGDIERVSIRPLVMDLKKINLTKTQSKIVLVTALAFVPLLVAGIGGVIWWKRRSL